MDCQRWLVGKRGADDAALDKDTADAVAKDNMTAGTAITGCVIWKSVAHQQGLI